MAHPAPCLPVCLPAACTACTACTACRAFRLGKAPLQESLALYRLRAGELGALALADLADLDDPNVGLEQKGEHVRRLLELPSTGLKEHVALQDSLRARLKANSQARRRVVCRRRLIRL